jgi:hypothetical protein
MQLEHGIEHGASPVSESRRPPKEAVIRAAALEMTPNELAAGAPGVARVGWPSSRIPPLAQRRQGPRAFPGVPAMARDGETARGSHVRRHNLMEEEES